MQRHRYYGEGSTNFTSCATWRGKAAKLYLDCCASYADEQELRMHNLRDLLKEAPNPDLISGLAIAEIDRLNSLLANHAWESAIFSMFGKQLGYMLSRGADGSYLASVTLPGSAREATSTGDTVALAFVGAIALALAEND